MRYLVISKKRLVLIAIFLCGILAVLFTSLSATSVITANSGARKIPIYSVERDDRKIALTFNVAWDDKDVRKVLDILDNYGVKSTFFFVGEWVQKYP
ncbi:MAG: polysaccharide deacetylase family protein, partial [Oscillospiraceae bacterium]|nr:polysaccharide deacetylase family protein [Oscillospiraceae bacterium]